METLQIYEVIFWEGDGEPDTIYLITAHTHLEAVEIAEIDRRDKLNRGQAGLRPKADAVCLIGESRIDSHEPQLLRGPFRETGYTRGATWLFDGQTEKWLTYDEYHPPQTRN